MSDGLQSDRVLVRRLLRGEERAFEEFFAGYFPRLYRFTLTRMRYDHDASEDIVQATLCRAITVLKTFRGEAPLFTWLCTLCRREMSAYIKRESKHQAPMKPLDDAPDVRAALESIAMALEGNPEDDLRRKEIAHIVQVTLDFLPSGYGDVLEWKYARGLSVKEIAAQMKLSPKATESLLTRAREAFRKEFASVTEGRLHLRAAKTET